MNTTCQDISEDLFIAKAIIFNKVNRVLFHSYQLCNYQIFHQITRNVSFVFIK